MNVLVIGGGSIGQRHIRNLKALPGVTVAACTNNAAIGSSLDVAVSPDLLGALASRPAAAIVANVTNRHLPAALAAAEQGCHLLIEKPLSHNLDGIHALKRVTEQRKLAVMVGCNMRFHPALQVIKRVLDVQRIGPVFSVEAHCGSYLPEWRPGRDYRSCYSSYEAEGGGVVLDLIHELDYLQWWFGSVEAVAAFLSRRSALEIQTEDVADMLLRFRSGLVAQVHLDYVQRVPTRGCRIIGRDGTLVWEDEKGRVSILAPSAPEEMLWEMPVGYDWNQMYVEELRHFLGCIETGRSPLISLDEGEEVLQVALAAKTAAREQRVVML